MISLDIVVPVKNEEENLEPLIQRITEAFKNKRIDVSLIFIVDKSTDNTLRVLQQLSKKYPIRFYEKIGIPGKGFSLIQGLSRATSDYLAFIDADLQYPPEALPGMLEQLIKEELGVVVANRKTYNTKNKLRKFMSKSNRFVFGRLLSGLTVDTQSGMKVFKKEIFEVMPQEHINAWSFDIPLLITAKRLGYKLGSYDIEFMDRRAASSKVNVVKGSIEVASTTLKTKFGNPVIKYPHENLDRGDITFYNGNKFETHNELPHHKSALYTFSIVQKTVLWILAISLITLLVSNYVLAIQVVIALLSIIYFSDFALSVFLVHRSMENPPEITSTIEELDALRDEDLPIYTVLSPLYKESQILPHFVEAISKMHWPKDKLDVLLLLEENDPETIEAAENMDLPDYFKVVVVPHSMPKTKPKACNYGLKIAKGELVTIYDAEDKPDLYQLKKAYLAFQKCGEKTVCVQGKLNYFNKEHNLLTKFFTAEYSLWFEVILPSLQSINTMIPLGGTSNHFRTAVLRKLHGWDPFNVTEDCDLGVRLFKEGYKTAIIDSVTLEEANSNVGNWIRQRSRWLKGYLQTYFVHMRNPKAFIRDHKLHTLLFQLIIGLRISFILINPIMWMLTASYFLFYDTVGLFIESLYPAPVFYLAVVTLVFGNFFYIYYYMIGLAAHKHWDLIKYVFLIPVYWLLMSIAAMKAFKQLLFNPHYWEKTNHGLHFNLGKKTKKFSLGSVPNISLPKFNKPNISLNLPKINTSKIPYAGKFLNSDMLSGSMLVMGSLAANFLNFVYNAVISRNVSVEDFGLVSLIGNLLFLVSIPFSSLSRTVCYKSAYLLGKDSNATKLFWNKTFKQSLMFSVGVLVLWLASLPLLSTFFKSDTYLPFILFSPVLLIGLVGAINSGYISGSQKFSALGVIKTIEAVLKLTIAILIIWLGLNEYIYLAITLSIFSAFIISLIYAFKLKNSHANLESTYDSEIDKGYDISFPKRFYASSILISFSLVSFISFDLLLVKHYLDPTQAGLYALIALTGKMIFLIGTLLGQFIVPVISKKEGSNESSTSTFNSLLKASTIASFGMYIVFGVFGKFTGPLLFGNKIDSVTYLLPLYGMGIFFFTVSTIFTSYNQTKDKHIFSVASFILAALYILGIGMFHNNLDQIVLVTAIAGVVNFIVAVALHLGTIYQKTLQLNIRNLLDLLKPLPIEITQKNAKPTILILNWRDLAHKWAGGAEVYVHEIGKRLVNNDYKVIVFCGNDHFSETYEVVEGIHIIRRGGFVMVYVWATIYYLLKLRKHVDVILDSENGVPFFSPIYSKKPVVGLIHHVHSTVFDENLSKPLAMFANLLESGLMPIVYRNSKMITVSNSSKADMEKIGLGKNFEIDIVHPGIELAKFKPGIKAEVPTILYLGRLKNYKSIDTIINIMHGILEEHPNAKLKIAGFGESMKQLKELAKSLNLTHAIEFLGKVTEEEKIKLLAEAWVFVYPSAMEGWGISVIEANASGTPVVASNVPGLRDSVSNPHSGFLVTFGDKEKFKERILLILGNKEIREGLEVTSIEWSQNYTWEKSVEKLIDILDAQHKNHG